MKTVFQFLALANAASPMQVIILELPGTPSVIFDFQGRSMSLRDRLNCAQANYMILTGLDEPSYPALPEYTPWMMETVSGDEVGECRAGECRAECRAGDMVIAGCGCWESGDDFWQFHEDEGKF